MLKTFTNNLYNTFNLLINQKKKKITHLIVERNNLCMHVCVCGWGGYTATKGKQLQCLLDDDLCPLLSSIHLYITCYGIYGQHSFKAYLTSKF